MNETAIGEFIAILRNSSTVTHLMHLQVFGQGSFAKHSALGEYYAGIPDLVDSVAEAIQGRYQTIIMIYPDTLKITLGNPLTYLQNLLAYVDEARKDLPQDSEIQNEIDSIATFIDHTCYKLKFLE
jgi:DNA-binding ferritin-like protein